MPLREFLALLHSSQQQAMEQQRQRQGGAAAAAAMTSVAAPEAPAAAVAFAPGVVPYLQYQNSSLTAKLPRLLGDVDLILSWADEAFGETAAGLLHAVLYNFVARVLDTARCGSGTACHTMLCLLAACMHAPESCATACCLSP
jgi:hypothetical protein